jgi:hypothetical protein
MFFKCIICERKITDVSIIKNFVEKQDYTHNFLAYCRVNTKYLEASVTSLTYDCKCGTHEIRDPKLIDFVRDSDSIRPADLAQGIYGCIEVCKKS